MRGWRIAAAALTLSLVSGAARAEVNAEDLAVAQEHFARARDQQVQKDWSGCVISIQQALQIFETPGLLFHLAFCKEQQHLWVEALIDYRRAGELIEGGVEAEDVVELLPAAIEQLASKTPKLQVVVEPLPAGSRLYVDGKELSKSLIGTSIPLNPGARTVRVTAPGHVEFLQDINLVPQDRRTLRVRLVSKGGADKRTHELMEPTAGIGGAQGLVLVSEAVVALAGLGVGIGYTAYISSRESLMKGYQSELDSPDACLENSMTHQCQSIQRSIKEINEARPWQQAGFITAGAAAAAFLVTWLVWPDSEDSAGLVVPYAHAKGGGLQVLGSF